MRRLTSIAALVVAATLLSGCTLIETLQAGGQQPTTTAAPTTETALDPTGSDAPTGSTQPTAFDPDARVNIQMVVGQAHEIHGKDGTVVGTITIDGVKDNAACTNPVADASKNGKFVTTTFTIVANEALKLQSDSYYGTHFDFTHVDVVNPYTGVTTAGGVDYDCLPAQERLSTVQAGRTVTGTIAFDVSNESFAIAWFYGNQYFYVPPSVWSGK